MDPQTKWTITANSLKELLDQLEKWLDRRRASDAVNYSIVPKEATILIYYEVAGRSGYHQQIHTSPAVLRELVLIARQSVDEDIQQCLTMKDSMASKANRQPPLHH